MKTIVEIIRKIIKAFRIIMIVLGVSVFGGAAYLFCRWAWGVHTGEYPVWTVGLFVLGVLFLLVNGAEAGSKSARKYEAEFQKQSRDNDMAWWWNNQNQHK